MTYLVQYQNADGHWYTGHRTMELKDPAGYQIAVEKNKGTKTRVVDNETGEIFGESPCGFCQTIHNGVEGSCLL